MFHGDFSTFIYQRWRPFTVLWVNFDNITAHRNGSLSCHINPFSVFLMHWEKRAGFDYLNLIGKIVELGIRRRYQRLIRSHPERRLALSKESATLSAHSDVLWRASFRVKTAIISLSEYGRVNILFECQIVRHNGIIIAPNDILAGCLRIGRVEEAWIKI